jgi:hypothetical protein
LYWWKTPARASHRAIGTRLSRDSGTLTVRIFGTLPETAIANVIPDVPGDGAILSQLVALATQLQSLIDYGLWHRWGALLLSHRLLDKLIG